MSLSATFARKLERWRAARRERPSFGLTQQQQRALERKRKRRERNREACHRRVNDQRAEWVSISSKVCRVAMDLQRGNGRVVEFARAGGVSYEMIAQDYRADVMLVIRQTQLKFPTFAAMDTAAHRRRFREKLGRAFCEAGLWPLSAYFAGSRPRRTRSENTDYVPRDQFAVRLARRMRLARRKAMAIQG